MMHMFPGAWGLDSSGSFRSNKPAAVEPSGSTLEKVHRALRKAAEGAVSEYAETSNVEDRVLSDLKDVHVSLLEEEAIERARERSDKEKGRRLLYLFQRDLLPGLSGKILESKKNRELKEVRAVLWKTKLIGWLFVILLNGFMLAYVLLFFATGESSHRQGAWAQSLFIALASDILIISSLSVIFTHVYVPSLIMNDVSGIKRHLVERIRLFNSRVQDARDNQPPIMSARVAFDATKYLFVSTRLAQRWPSLKESQIILEFHTPWKQSYQRESDVEGKYALRYTAAIRSLSVVASGLTQLPLGIQDTLIQTVSTVTAGCVTLVHAILYEMNPLLVAAPLVVLCVAVGLVVYCCLCKRPAPQPAADAEEVDEEIGAESIAAIHPAPVVPLKRGTSLARVVPLNADMVGHAAGSNYRVVSPRGHLGRAESMRQGIDVIRALQIATASQRDDDDFGRAAGFGSSSRDVTRDFFASTGGEDNTVRVFNADRDLPARGVATQLGLPGSRRSRRLAPLTISTGNLSPIQGGESSRRRPATPDDSRLYGW
jgi:hypothetical protein